MVKKYHNLYNSHRNEEESEENLTESSDDEVETT